MLRVFLGLLLALLVSLLLPRLRGLVLTLFALALGAVGGLFVITASTMPIALFALLSFASVFLALLLPRVLPRIFIALFSIVALPFALLTAHGKAGLAIAVAGLIAVLFFSVRKPDHVFRIDCASLGSYVFATSLPDTHRLVFRLIAFVFLFALQELARRNLFSSAQRDPIPIPRMARVAAVFAAAAFVLIFCLPLLATPVVLRGDDSYAIKSVRPDLEPIPYRERSINVFGRISTLSSGEPDPRLLRWGGLVWPLPSEAAVWDEPNLDRGLFPRIDNLDALYLGVRTQGLVYISRASEVSRSGPRLLSQMGAFITSAWLPISLHKPIAAARLVQDQAALVRLQAAATATVAALHDILPLIQPGAKESDLEAAMKLAMRTHGCGPESFPLIFASGAEAAEPHGNGNLGMLKEGDLLVADVGCEIDHYASDFTRTLPVSGTFTPRQKQLYENVFRAQAAALAQCRPGARLSSFRGGDDSMEKTAREVLKKGAPDGEAHMDHGLGHTVGLFVHDIFLSGPLEEGNVITIEPGTYLKSELGIRIEDTFVVGKDGCTRLTEGFPAGVEAVETSMKAR